MLLTSSLQVIEKILSLVVKKSVNNLSLINSVNPVFCTCEINFMTLFE